MTGYVGTNQNNTSEPITLLTLSHLDEPWQPY